MHIALLYLYELVTLFSKPLWNILYMLKEKYKILYFFHMYKF